MKPHIPHVISSVVLNARNGKEVR